MVRRAIFAVFLLSATACAEARVSATERKCPFTEKDLIGAWWNPITDSEIVENDGRGLDFEEANGDRVFREYLHHRPMSAGTWTFEACQIVGTYQGGGNEEFRLEGDDEPVLVGNPDDADYRAVYTKVAEGAPG